MTCNLYVDQAYYDTANENNIINNEISYCDCWNPS